MRGPDVRWIFGVVLFTGLGLGGCATPPEPPKMASARMLARSGSSVEGHVHFHQVGDKVNVAYEIDNLAPNSKHGFHLHEKGDCSAADASSAGGHFNPMKTEHGLMDAKSHHAGDLGNIVANDKGMAKGELTLDHTQLATLHGLAVIVHDKVDDGHTQPTGNAGGRIACGVID